MFAVVGGVSLRLAAVMLTRGTRLLPASEALFARAPVNGTKGPLSPAAKLSTTMGPAPSGVELTVVTEQAPHTKTRAVCLKATAELGLVTGPASV